MYGNDNILIYDVEPICAECGVEPDISTEPFQDLMDREVMCEGTCRKISISKVSLEVRNASENVDSHVTDSSLNYNQTENVGMHIISYAETDSIKDHDDRLKKMRDKLLEIRKQKAISKKKLEKYGESTSAMSTVPPTDIILIPTVEIPRVTGPDATSDITYSVLPYMKKRAPQNSIKNDTSRFRPRYVKEFDNMDVAEFIISCQLLYENDEEHSEILPEPPDGDSSIC